MIDLAAMVKEQWWFGQNRHLIIVEWADWQHTQGGEPEEIGCWLVLDPFSHKPQVHHYVNAYLANLLDAAKRGQLFPALKYDLGKPFPEPPLEQIFKRRSRDYWKRKMAAWAKESGQRLGSSLAGVE